MNYQKRTSIFSGIQSLYLLLNMNNLTEHQKGLLFVFIAAFLWSSGGLFIKLITLSPMQISFFRCIIAAATFIIIFRKGVIQFNKLTLLNSLFYAAVLISFVILSDINPINFINVVKITKNSSGTQKFINTAIILKSVN